MFCCDITWVSILQQPLSYKQRTKLLFVWKCGHTHTPANFISLTSILITLMPDASLEVSVLRPDARFSQWGKAMLMAIIVVPWGHCLELCVKHCTDLISLISLSVWKQDKCILRAFGWWRWKSGHHRMAHSPCCHTHCSLGKQVSNGAQFELAYSSLALSSSH